jgi:hypothetical protein
MLSGLYPNYSSSYQHCLISTFVTLANLVLYDSFGLSQALKCSIPFTNDAY